MCYWNFKHRQIYWGGKQTYQEFISSFHQDYQANTNFLQWHEWYRILGLNFMIVEACFIEIWTASSEFGTYRLCEQRRFRRACASAQSRQNLRCSLIQAVNQEEPSDRIPDPWPLWIAGHAQLKFVMTECSKTQIRLTGLIWYTELPSNAKIAK